MYLSSTDGPAIFSREAMFSPSLNCNQMKEKNNVTRRVAPALALEGGRIRVEQAERESLLPRAGLELCSVLTLAQEVYSHRNQL